MADIKGPSDNNLSGTTLRVYRYLYRTGRPQGIHDVQHGLDLSSSSVASYHLKKLQSMGLIKETENGSSKYFVDKLIFDNMIRFRRSLIPIQIGYVVFFLCTLAILLIIFRPNVLTGSYIFSTVIIAIACGIFGYQTLRSLRTMNV
jgi:hypothetical protein